MSLYGNEKIVIAADLGGTNLRTAAVDENGAILFRTSRKTPHGEHADEIVRAIVENALECQKNCPEFAVKAISAAVPGTISVECGLIFKAPNLPALDNFQISAALEKELGIKAIIENDANAAAIGENWRGASKGFADSIMVMLGTGVGGIIIDGKIWRGKDGTAGEISHICVEPCVEPCGCVEQYSSASAIVRLAKDLAAQFPKSSLNQHSQLTARCLSGGNGGRRTRARSFPADGFLSRHRVGGLDQCFEPGSDNYRRWSEGRLEIVFSAFEENNYTTNFPRTGGADANFTCCARRRCRNNRRGAACV